MHFIHTCMIHIFKLDEFALTFSLFPTCFIKRFHIGMIYHAYDTVAYSLLILMTPFLLSNRSNRGSGTISCCEGLKIPLTCWSRQIQSIKRCENKCAAQKDKASSRWVCIFMSNPIWICMCLHVDVYMNASGSLHRCERNAKDPESWWKGRSIENTLLKPSAEWSNRRAVC